MKYGYFDKTNKEYVITSYDTPLPWINYLSNGELISLISNHGGGYTFFKDAKYRRLTRFTYNSPSRDNGGRMFYLKDEKDTFSPCYYPSRTSLDSYECHVGLNYQRFVSTKNDVSMDLLCFIPLNYNVEINKLVIRNNSNKEKKLSLFGGVEFCLWNALDDMTNFQRNFSTGEVEVLQQVIIHKTEYRERRNHFSYFATNVLPKAYQTDRDTFLGVNRDYINPIEVENNKLTNKVASGWSPIAFFQSDLVLKPGEEKTIIYLLGYEENKEDEKFDKDGLVNKTNALKTINYLFDVNNVDKEFKKINEHWEELLSHYHIESGDDKLDNMVNVWHQYQCMTTYQLSRSASYYESGIGRGMGFRDSCQDLLGFVHLIPSLARERILDIASIMKKDGSTYHQYQPLDKKGNADIGDGFNDDPLWLIAATYSYLAETNDYSILSEAIPFDREDKGTLLEHLTAAYNYTLSHLGPHGLPLIGHADWNDCLNLNCFSTNPNDSFQCYQGKDTGIAESVFIAAMFVKYGQEYASILNNLKLDNSSVLANVNKMKEAIYKYGYDTDHFLRAYDAFGNKVGSYENKEGQIYIEPQGFAVMAGLGLENGLAAKALNTVYERLNTKYGICLLTPCYSSYHLELGEVSSYPKGYKENGGIFCHNNPWVIIAECINNNGDRAFQYYKQITPTYIEDISDVHKTEPYVYSQMIGGKEAVNFGEAKNSWLTGTAAWSFVSVSEYLLGIRPTLEGLLIEPKIKIESPIKVTRKYINHVIHIELTKNEKKLIKKEDVLSSLGDIYVNI